MPGSYGHCVSPPKPGNLKIILGIGCKNNFNQLVHPINLDSFLQGTRTHFLSEMGFWKIPVSEDEAYSLSAARSCQLLIYVDMDGKQGVLFLNNGRHFIIVQPHQYIQERFRTKMAP